MDYQQCGIYIFIYAGEGINFGGIKFKINDFILDKLVPFYALH